MLSRTQITWQRLPPIPVGVYDLRAAADATALHIYGGHLCTDTKGDAPYFYTNAVHRLELGAVQVPESACRVATEEVSRAAKAALVAARQLDSTGSDEL